MKKERSLVWCILLYPDNERHLKALEFIKKNYVEYAFILHKPEADEKKAHYHVVVRFKNYRWNTALSEELDIELNMFEKCRNLDNALLYLIHFREENKIQYDLDDVHGSFKLKIKRLMETDGKDNSDIALDLVSWLNSCTGIVSYQEFLLYACNNGYYGEFIRASRVFSRLLDEHNQEVNIIQNYDR